MAKDKIKEVLWKHPSLGEQGFGFRFSRLEEDNSVTVLEKSKDGELRYPGVYHFSKELALQQPTMMRRGVKLVLIPFSKCEVRDE